MCVDICGQDAAALLALHISWFIRAAKKNTKKHIHTEYKNAVSWKKDRQDNNNDINNRIKEMLMGWCRLRLLLLLLFVTVGPFAQWTKTDQHHLYGCIKDVDTIISQNASARDHKHTHAICTGCRCIADNVTCQTHKTYSDAIHSIINN